MKPLHAWTEPAAYLRAKAAETSKAAGLRRWAWPAFVAVMMAVTFALASWPDEPADWALLAVAVLVTTAAIACFVALIERTMGKRVVIDSSGIRVDGLVLAPAEIRYVVIGTIRLGPSEHEVMLVRMWDEVDYMVGRKPGQDPDALAATLGDLGIRIED